MGAFDQEPRSLALAARGLDMAHAGEIFLEDHLTILDRRNGYGDARRVSLGLLDK